MPRQKSQPMNVRLPDGMRDRIRQRAAANMRSMNAEIVHILDRALNTTAADTKPAPETTAA
ncbi:MAG: Arc family DNA-binding protein [Methylacidiphilales bacterium]|nr:Arc family DNA-binding protein [Candidatus Methylacidiphilales bacterium]